MSSRTLRIHPGDNVVVALDTIAKGHHVTRTCAAQVSIPAKHKVVIRAIGAGDPVIMYGITVGRALRDLAPGARLTVDNIVHDSAPYTLRNCKPSWTPPDVSHWTNRTFEGFHRADGQVGTANHWLVLPLVFCENRNVDLLRRAFEDELGYSKVSPYRRQVALLAHSYRTGRSEPKHEEIAAPDRLFEFVDGIHFLTHQQGCGGTREDARGLCGLLAGYLHHPNVFGGTVLSLGCENAQVELLLDELNKRNPHFDKPLFIYRQQDYASADALLTRAIGDTFDGLRQANQARRSAAPLSALTLGLECGGSDGFSGISANPAMGHASDILVALDGKAILAEFPELCGVEQALMDRCVERKAAERFARLMQSYSELAKAVGSGFEANPSPGNMRDGLLTDAMKSAGAARKGGTSPVTAVLDFPEYATESGLNLLCTPGGDVESVTAIAGAGAQVVLFSTGLGTPTGNPVAQVIKISSNTALSQRLPDLIDLDAGNIISGTATMETTGEAILELVTRVASGQETTCSGRLGQHDFIPWKRGVSL